MNHDHSFANMTEICKMWSRNRTFWRITNSWSMSHGQDVPPVIQSTVTDDEFGGFRITIPASDGARLGFGIAFAVWGLVTVLTLWSFAESPAA